MKVKINEQVFESVRGSEKVLIDCDGKVLFERLSGNAHKILDEWLLKLHHAGDELTFAVISKKEWNKETKQIKK